jgi:hypothetical protein
MHPRTAADTLPNTSDPTNCEFIPPYFFLVGSENMGNGILMSLQVEKDLDFNPLKLGDTFPELTVTT